METAESAERVATLLVENFSDPRNQKAIELVESAGFRLSISPVDYLTEPQLIVDSVIYEGLEEISAVVNTVSGSNLERSNASVPHL